MAQPIQYLNTDLDLVSPAGLAGVVAALGARGIEALNVSREADGSWRATFEAAECHDEPEASIAALLSAVESLAGPARSDWLACTLREFNVGYQCGPEPWAFNHGLTNRTLRRLADAGASLRITLYPPDGADTSRPADAGEP